MPRLHETLETALPLEETFDFVADFANAARWDPGIASSERVDDGPLGVGATYRLGVRMRDRVAPMTYRVTTWEPPHRVVLTGEGSGVAAVDDIRFAPRGDGSGAGTGGGTSPGTHIDYTADIRLTGWLRLVEPFVGGTFRRIADDAVGGMRRALEARAAAAGR
jgi:carbon monoxide dehydrogenase subunit G